MLPLFVATTILLAIALVVGVLKYDEMKESRNFWLSRWQGEIDENINLNREILEREQGVWEIEDNFFQDELTYKEKIYELTCDVAHYRKLSNSLEEIRLDHDVYCLPMIGGEFYPIAEEDDTPIFNSVERHPTLF